MQDPVESESELVTVNGPFYKLLGPLRSAVLDLERADTDEKFCFEVGIEYVDDGHGFSLVTRQGLIHWCVASMGQIDLVLWQVEVSGHVQLDVPFTRDASSLRASRLCLLRELGVIDVEVRRRMADWTCDLLREGSAASHPDAERYIADPSDFAACCLIMHASDEMSQKQQDAFGAELLCVFTDS